LTYSSIAHSSWILLITYISIKHWTIYFLIYFVTLAPIIIFITQFNLIKVSEIYSLNISIWTKLSLSTLMLSLGGLPPFLGFSAKLIALIARAKIISPFILFVLISSSLVSLFFYLKLFFNNLTNISISSKINFNRLKFNTTIIFIILGNLLLSSMVLLT